MPRVKRACPLGLVVLDCMSLGKHAIVQYTGDKYSTAVLPVENDVPAVFHATQAGSKVVTESSRRRIIGADSTTSLNVVEVSDSLRFAPGAKRVRRNAQQVRFGAAGESKPRHGLTPRRRKIERFSDAFENVAFGNAAGIAFVDGRPQRGHLRLIHLLFPLQSPQRRAHHVAGALVAAAFNLFRYKAVELVGQVNLAGWHKSLVEAAGVEGWPTQRLP